MNDNAVHIKFKNTQPLKVEGKVFRSAFDWELTEKDLEKAARELGETEEKKKIGLQVLKQKLSSESNIKYRQDDFYLMRFLRVRKYDVNRAYQNIKSFYELRKKYSDYFTLTSEIKSILQLQCLTILPYTDEDGVIIFWFNYNRWKQHERTYEEIAQSVTALSDVVFMNPTCQINGATGIHDYSGMTVGFISEFIRSGRLQTILSFTQNGYPTRIKKLIIVNTSRVTRIIYNILKLFLPKKLADKFILLGSDVEELHRHVNPLILPKTLKGCLEDEELDTSQVILDNLEYLKYERSFITE